MVDKHQQNTALGVIVAFPVLGGIAVLLRLWSRYLAKSKLGSDDYLITLGYLMAVAQSVTSWYYVKTNYIGIHSWDIPPDRDYAVGLKWNFANQILYNPTLTVIKVSILLFLRRLESHSRLVNSLIWGTMGVTVGLCGAVLIVEVFQCKPVAYVYDMSLNGTCIAQGAFYVSTAAMNLFTDILVISIPVILTWRLQMQLRKKIAVCVILSLGFVATAIGLWRVIILAQGFFPTSPPVDPTYDIGFCSSAVEVNVAVVTACAPSTKAIASKYLPRLLGTSRGGTSTANKYPGHSSRFRSAGQRSRSAVDDFEMADPYRNRVDVSADREMRKYRGMGETSSLSSEEGAGIVKTMDVEVRNERMGSGEWLV